MEQLLTVKFNGVVEVQVPKGTTILEAARKAGITIPTLCYLKDINAIGACRICVVEVQGARGLCAACVYPTRMKPYFASMMAVSESLSVSSMTRVEALSRA